VALVDNASGGLINLRGKVSYSNAKDYNKGQGIGDVGSILIGGAEIGGGGTIAAGGVTLFVGSGGTLAIAGAPATAGGVVMAGHGVAVVKTAATNFANQKGRVDERKYKDLKEPKNVGPNKPTTPAQRKRILEENKRQNNGNLVSDGDGRPLNQPKKMVKGQKADMNQAEVDHIDPKSNGGSNSNSNLRLISKEENLIKGNRIR